MDRTVTNLHCINDAWIVSVVFPSQLAHTFLCFFCLGGRLCPMPFNAPESDNHSILYIREVALFGML